MADIGPLIRSPEKLQFALAARDGCGVEEDCARLLELRTETGVVYVCPSRWQRIRLLWAFRHFHVLPVQLLSRRDRRLIERLLRLAPVTPDFPVAKSAVFGVVEKAYSKSAASARRATTARAELANAQAFPAKPGLSVLPDLDLSNPERRFVEKFSFGYRSAAHSSGPVSVHEKVAVKHKAIEDTAGGRAARGVRDALPQQWALGLLAVVCFAVILARICGIPLLPGNPQTPSPPVRQTADHIKPPDLHTAAIGTIRLSPPTVSLPSIGKLKLRAAPPLPELALAPLKSLQQPDESEQSMKTGSSAAAIMEPAAIDPSGTSGRLFVSELPQDYFVAPVVSDPNLVGELHLKALIGADGSVKEVTVLSGSPKLAKAGIRAVRQWRYKPYQVLGRPIEVETQIEMSFFGQDAVSITSVASNPASEFK